MDRSCAAAAHIKAMDSDCLHRFGIPTDILMENAGRSIAEEIISRKAPCTCAVLAGGGNNGGDGLAAARHLDSAGFSVRVFLLNNDAETPNRLILDRLGISVFAADTLEPDAETLEYINNAEIVLDAVFGVGFREPLRDCYIPFVRALHPKGTVFAADIPSGINSDTGQGTAILPADYTVTLHCPKIGLYLYPGREYAGKIITASLGVKYPIDSSVYLKEDFCIPPRAPQSYKGSFPHAGIIGGRLGMTGAGILAAKAALMCGGGLVSVAAPASYAHIYEGSIPEAMTVPIEGCDEFGYTDEALKELLQFAENKDILVIGPGFGRQNKDLVKEIMINTACRLIADADALWAVGQDEALLAKIGPGTVFTPHYGEMSFLTGLSIAEIKADKLRTAKEFAEKYNTCIVLKGPDTVTAYSDRVYINTSGCAAMAGAGFGDVLSGMLASGAAAPEDTVYWHGLAGERAAADLTEHCVTAGDIIKYLPVCIREQENKNV